MFFFEFSWGHGVDREQAVDREAPHLGGLETSTQSSVFLTSNNHDHLERPFFAGADKPTYSNPSGLDRPKHAATTGRASEGSLLWRTAERRGCLGSTQIDQFAPPPTSSLHSHFFKPSTAGHETSHPPAQPGFPPTTATTTAPANPRKPNQRQIRTPRHSHFPRLSPTPFQRQAMDRLPPFSKQGSQARDGI